MQVEVFEHQAEASFPADVTQPVQYGNRLRAQISYLNNYQLLSWQRTCALIEDFFDELVEWLDVKGKQRSPNPEDNARKLQ